MWLVSEVGFFSIVRKDTDIRDQTLTVRARVREDLDGLRAKFIPDLGPTEESSDADYRFRAVAPTASVGRALERLVHSIDYNNFKSRVGARQGKARAGVYANVWSSLLQLQSQTYSAKAKASAVVGRAGDRPSFLRFNEREEGTP